MKLGGELYLTEQWQSLAGTVVEVHHRGRRYRTGKVDTAMPDSSGVWLAADGALTREYIEKAEGFVLWTNFYPPTERHGGGQQSTAKSRRTGW